MLICASNAPLSVFFISETVEGGQSVTIKNISANSQGDWRIALMGENAAHFRINEQRGDFEYASDHYVQLPNSLLPGDEWGFILTAVGLDAGQHSVELALWTTQGQPQLPFNGTVLGRTMIYTIVEEKAAEDESGKKHKEDKVNEGPTLSDTDVQAI